MQRSLMYRVSVCVFAILLVVHAVQSAPMMNSDTTKTGTKVQQDTEEEILVNLPTVPYPDRAQSGSDLESTASMQSSPDALLSTSFSQQSLTSEDINVSEKAPLPKKSVRFLTPSASYNGRSLPRRTSSKKRAALSRAQQKKIRDSMYGEDPNYDDGKLRPIAGSQADFLNRLMKRIDEHEEFEDSALLDKVGTGSPFGGSPRNRAPFTHRLMFDQQLKKLNSHTPTPAEEAEMDALADALVEKLNEIWGTGSQVSSRSDLDSMSGSRASMDLTTASAPEETMPNLLNENSVDEENALDELSQIVNDQPEITESRIPEEHQETPPELAKSSDDSDIEGFTPDDEIFATDEEIQTGKTATLFAEKKPASINRRIYESELPIDATLYPHEQVELERKHMLQLLKKQYNEAPSPDESWNPHTTTIAKLLPTLPGSPRVKYLFAEDSIEDDLPDPAKYYWTTEDVERAVNAERKRTPVMPRLSKPQLIPEASKPRPIPQSVVSRSHGGYYTKEDGTTTEEYFPALTVEEADAIKSRFFGTYRKIVDPDLFAERVDQEILAKRRP